MLMACNEFFLESSLTRICTPFWECFDTSQHISITDLQRDAIHSMCALLCGVLQCLFCIYIYIHGIFFIGTYSAYGTNEMMWWGHDLWFISLTWNLNNEMCSCNSFAAFHVFFSFLHGKRLKLEHCLQAFRSIIFTCSGYEHYWPLPFYSTHTLASKTFVVHFDSY